MWTRVERRARLALTAVMLAAAVAVPPAIVAAPQPSRSCSGKVACDHVLGTHATRGVVRSIDATTMVIERAGQPGDMRFDLTSATYRAGLIEVGSVVSVRYREDGKNHVATAIALRRPKLEGQ
jgi:hypothetical protein